MSSNAGAGRISYASTVFGETYPICDDRRDPGDRLSLELSRGTVDGDLTRLEVGAASIAIEFEDEEDPTASIGQNSANPSFPAERSKLRRR